MQAFANVATAPVRKTTQSGGKVYWEFRAAESAKNEDKAAATWYTVRVFQEADPGFSKGDFVRLVGKLKLDVFMSREGKPMGVLVVMCYEAKRYDKGSKSPHHADADTAVQQLDSSTDRQESAASRAESVQRTPSVLDEKHDTVDESWLALAA